MLTLDSLFKAHQDEMIIIISSRWLQKKQVFFEPRQKKFEENNKNTMKENVQQKLINIFIHRTSADDDPLSSFVYTNVQTQQNTSMQLRTFREDNDSAA